MYMCKMILYHLFDVYVAGYSLSVFWDQILIRINCTVTVNDFV